jgi:hypothetical protein
MEWIVLIFTFAAIILTLLQQTWILILLVDLLCLVGLINAVKNYQFYRIEDESGTFTFSKDEKLRMKNQILVTAILLVLMVLVTWTIMHSRRMCGYRLQQEELRRYRQIVERIGRR